MQHSTALIPFESPVPVTATDQIAKANSLKQAHMADDETQEINEESKKDREDAEQAKALNAVTDNESSSSGRLYAAVTSVDSWSSWGLDWLTATHLTTTDGLSASGAREAAG